MERSLAEAASKHLWQMLFALVVELSIRSGLITENDLADEVPRAEVEKEQGEESADEHDPIVEFALGTRHKPCDIATDHNDHICYNCEQRQLFPERISKWKLSICNFCCQKCATQRCCTRSAHEYYLCMQCERMDLVVRTFGTNC